MGIKNLLRKRFVLAITVFLVVLVTLQVMLVFSSKSKSSENRSQVKATSGLAVSQNLDQYKKQWQQRINEVGTKKAYEEFKSEYKKAGFGDQHQLAHIIGVLIYEKDGLNGVLVCDNNFAFGCYHSFFGKAISDKGYPVINELDQICVKKYGSTGLGCQHGIGHGLLGSLGEFKLEQSLDLCATLTWKGPIGGCTSGVFMEYNFKTMVNPANTEMRDFDESNPHTPCNLVAQKFGQACYFEQSAWWARVTSSNYKKAGDLCSEVKGNLEMEACFRGLGNTIAPDSSYNVSKTKEGCAKMPNNNGRVLCLAGASWSFFAEPKFRNLSMDLCVGLEEEDQSFCVTKSDLLNNGKK